MQLKIVLLPDPFGPISPRISPSLTSNETSLTARRAPNLLVSPETLKIGMRGISSAHVPDAMQRETVLLSPASSRAERSRVGAVSFLLRRARD